ncbi:MAG: glycerol-3-phosphate 1-O-acyltransferase PlsY [Verrucomicrobiota bacterium]|jgi:glycerol-3-phosphate acyltransferase PlsY
MFAAIGIFALLGYLIGSVNFAVLVAKKHGVDILKEGSGNPGATNVKRVLGKGPGNLVFALDALKGFVGAGLPYLFLRIEETGAAADIHFTVCVAGFVGTLLGHCFSCFLKFKGGKGVASTIGGLLVLLPIPILIGAAIWGLVFMLSRYVSLASIALGVSLPLSCWLLPLFTKLTFGQPEFWFAAAIAAFNVWTHRSNIGRLLAGTENRFVKQA